jgi:anaerobic selenocysteine-containing dehydrogenase
VDIFKNQTGDLADVLLPGITWLERSDIGAWDAMVETAPMLQTSKRVRTPIGDTRNEARIIAELSIAAGKPLLGNRFLSRLWAGIDLDAWVPRMLKPVQWLFRGRLQGAEGLPWKRATPGYYSGQRHKRLRFWSDDLSGEPERLAAFADRIRTIPDEGEFLLMGRRRRLAQNSWIHNAGRDVKPKDACAWLSAEDMARCGFADGDVVTIQSDAGEIVIPVMTHNGLMPGTITVPHGLPDVNVNRLISSDQRYIEPASGMHQMIGHRVTLKR